MFVSPADTTGVTQLLDQINQKLHLEYKTSKEGLFTPWMTTINREGFMLTLSEMWGKWATKETIMGVAKRVGITVEGLNVEHTQQDKFAQAASCIDVEATDNSLSSSSSSTLQGTPSTTNTSYQSMISSPESERDPQCIGRISLSNHRKLFESVMQKAFNWKTIQDCSLFRK